MNNTRADKLVFIHSNSHFQSQFCQIYEVGPYRSWDIDPENDNMEDSVTRFAEMRWSSLDSECVEMPNEEEATQDCSRAWLAAIYKPSSKLVKGSNSKDRGQK